MDFFTFTYAQILTKGMNTCLLGPAMGKLQADCALYTYLAKTRTTLNLKQPEEG